MESQCLLSSRGPQSVHRLRALWLKRRVVAWESNHHNWPTVYTGNFPLSIPQRYNGHLLLWLCPEAQVANTRPTGQTHPPLCFIQLALCFSPVAAPISRLTVKGSYIYTVLKLHLALWRQPRSCCGPWWKWVWHPWPKGKEILRPWLISFQSSL